MKPWALFIGILILGMIFLSGCTQTTSSPSTVTTTSIQPTPLVTEQTSQPTPQPTVEVTKTLEKPLPLTETYSYHTGRFSFKYPSGYSIYTVPYETTKYRQLLLVKNKSEDSFVPKENIYYTSSEGWNESIFNYDPLSKQSVLKVYVFDSALDDTWRLISNSLIHDKKGNTFWKTYDNGFSEDVSYNKVKWIKIINENAIHYYISNEKYREILKDQTLRDQFLGNYRDKNLADFMSYIDIKLTSDKCVNYFLRYRTPVGSMVWFEYDVNAKWNGEPMPKDGFNQATFEEIVKSFTIVER